MRIALLATDGRNALREYKRSQPDFGTAPDSLIDGFRMLPGLEIHVISCTQQPMESPSRLGPNVHFHSLHVPKLGWLRTGYQGCVRAVNRALRQIEPDLVHAQGTERDCAISAVFSPYPKLLTIHGNLRLIDSLMRFPKFSPLWLQARLEGFLVPRFDGVICITNYTLDAVANEVARTWLIPNAVDKLFFKVRPIRSSIPRILCVGHIDPRKNQNALIEALEPIANKLSFQVCFFGSAGRNEYTKEFYALLNANPWCRYGGMLSRDDLRKQFASASLLVLPTREDNCPMVVLEAMAAGVPVVASKVGGIPDLIQDGETGLFCNPDDADSMRSAVTRLLEDPPLRVRLASRARGQALARFHPRVIAERHLDVYRELTNSDR